MKELEFSDWKCRKYYYRQYNTRYCKKIKVRDCEIENKIKLYEFYLEKFEQIDGEYKKKEDYYYLGVTKFGKKKPLVDLFWIQCHCPIGKDTKVIYFENRWLPRTLLYPVALVQLHEQLKEEYSVLLPREMNELIVEGRLMANIEEIGI